MLKIRLMRIGAKQRPFYRVVAVDERAKRTGAYIELLGTYNPLTEPKDIKLKQDRIDYWTKQGAQLSTGFLRIIGKAPQRLPRKPKKERKEGAKEAPVEAAQAQQAEEPKIEEAPTAQEEPQTEETAPAEETAPQEETKTEKTPEEVTPAEEPKKAEEVKEEEGKKTDERPA